MMCAPAFPSPRTSPLGRGGIILRPSPIASAGFSKRASQETNADDSHSLSPGERVRVRGKRALDFHRVACCLFAVAFAVTGCRQEMFDQPRANPLRASEFFRDGAASQSLPPSTVARGFLNDDEALYSGSIGTNLVTEFPFRISQGTLERGRERFDIYCAPCHGRTGEGNGMIVQRGFPAPPSYHTKRLRNAPVGHFYDVMTRGYGLMYPQASRIAPSDRWAIAAYIRALQLSHSAVLADVSTEQRALLEAGR